MTAVWWVAVIVTSWLTIGVGMALLIGAAVAEADRNEPSRGDVRELFLAGVDQGQQQ